MVDIDEILKLPEAKQLAIMFAIQDNLRISGTVEDIEKSDRVIAFIDARIKAPATANRKGCTWEDIQESLKGLRN
jgi:hypothetical protein